MRRGDHGGVHDAGGPSRPGWCGVVAGTCRRGRGPDSDVAGRLRRGLTPALVAAEAAQGIRVAVCGITRQLRCRIVGVNVRKLIQRGLAAVVCCVVVAGAGISAATGEGTRDATSNPPQESPRDNSSAQDGPVQRTDQHIKSDSEIQPQNICNFNESYYKYGVGNTSFYTEIFGVTTTWRNMVSNGPSLWSNAVSIVNATHGSTPSNKRATMVESSASWLGLYTATGTRANRSFLIQVNRTSLVNNYGQANLGNYARSTAVHEFGHALSLKDNPSTQYVSIMKYTDVFIGRNPWPYDIDCVHTIY